MTAPFYVPPEQLIKDRAEFARKGIQRGRPIAVLEYDEGYRHLTSDPIGGLEEAFTAELLAKSFKRHSGRMRVRGDGCC